MILLTVAACPGPGPSHLPPGRAALIYGDSEGRRTMTSLMFDSDNPAVLADAKFAGCRVATYADLLTPEIVAQFAGRLVVIDRGHGDPMNLAHVADIESGAFSVESGAAKIKEWNAEGRGHVGAYVDRSDWSAVLSACLPVKPYTWIATLDGTLDPNGEYPSAVQFDGETAIGLHVDVSIVYDENWVPISQPLDVATINRLTGLAGSLVSLAGEVQATVKAL